MVTDTGFTEEQKQYLTGFLAGVLAKRGDRAAAPSGAAEPAPSGPEAIHHAAQDRFTASGRKLVAEEVAKRAKDPFAMWDEMRANAASGRFPKGTDVFLHKFHGLFYVAPAEEAFMCRLRMPNGILAAHQLEGLAELAESCGGGFADVTTRANLQIRRIGAARVIDVLTRIQELGLTSRGSGADNIRNITGSPTAGIDRQELIDTRPLARELHHHILNHRELYGLPRKFNVAFDGGGAVSVLEDTNDIGFAAVRVGEGEAVPPGVYFRVLLGGITGHGDFARDAGLLLTPEECLPAALALIRVFIENGDRTDRKRARLKYLLDGGGLEKYLAEAEKAQGAPFRRLPLAACLKRPPRQRGAHVGVHAQRQPGLFYAGVVLPVGRMTSAQMRGLAALARRCGSGAIRLTVWQNLLLSDIPEAALGAVRDGIASLGLALEASAVRAGLVACTGNAGCRFSATDTKAQALAIADHLDARLELDQPINIHLTGCPHSCAQHYVGDIGLLGTRVEAGEDAIEGYDVVVGGGAGETQALARPVCRGVPFAEVPPLLERMLRGYLAQRTGPGESFQEFVRRQDEAALRRLCGEMARAA
jgi:ferredoxin-nitrite reductase